MSETVQLLKEITKSIWLKFKSIYFSILMVKEGVMRLLHT